MSRRRKNGGVSGLLFVVLLVAAAGCAPITTADVDDFVAVTGVDRDPWPRHLTSGDLAFSVFEPPEDSRPREGVHDREVRTPEP